MSNLVSGTTIISNTGTNNTSGINWGLAGTSSWAVGSTTLSNCTINGSITLGTGNPTVILNEDLYNDVCDVQLNDGFSYKAIDDIFESATGRFYMQVMINYNYMNVSLDNIIEITESKNHLEGVKKKLIRNKKLKRIL